MRAIDFVQSYLDAWNHHSPEAVAEHLARDGIYCDIPEHAERSRDELVTTLRRFFAQFHHRYELVGDVLTSRNSIAIQYHMIPDDPSADTEYSGAEFITLTSDGALVIRDYYDVPNSRLSNAPQIARRAKPMRRKYAKSGLDAETLAGYRKRLDALMRSDRIYLRPDLTLPELARFVGCSVNHLSQVINSGCGESFFDYVNRHRIEHAKALLSDRGSDSPSVMSIAYAAGFNSGSAFYGAFRKCTGTTPARYRQAAIGH